MKIAICPGSFDPVTLGHVDLFERGARLFDKLLVMVSYNSGKNYHVSAEERKELLQMATAHIPNVEVIVHSGLVADYGMKMKIPYLLKGIRGETDADYEQQIAYVNRTVTEGFVDTLLLPTRAEYVYISSGIVREIASYGGDVAPFVPACIVEKIKELYRRK